MFRRLVRFAGHLCAVAVLAGVVLTASVHIASRDQSIDFVRSYGQALAASVFGTLETAPMIKAPVKPRELQTARLSPSEDLQVLTETPLAPSISRVIVAIDGKATLIGIATPGVEIAIKSEGRILGRANVSPSGRWKTRLDQELAQGDHRIRSVAYWPNSRRRLPGQEIRIALPQKLTREMVVHGPLDPEPDEPDTVEGTKTKSASETQVAQTRDRDRRARDRNRDLRDRQRREREVVTSPFFDWLRRSSEAYDAVIVRDLSGADAGYRYILGDTNPFEDRERTVEPATGDRERRVTGSGAIDRLAERMRTLNVRISEWFRQAQESYRFHIVEELSVGERVSRDRYVRREAEQESERSRRVLRKAPDNWDDLEPWPTPENRKAQVEPVPRAPIPEWPVVGETEPSWPKLPEIKANPENEALIRRAEQDAAKARALARKAAEQAEQARRETERLLAEEQRLATDSAARRLAAEKAARDAALKKRIEGAELRAAAAEKRAADAERLAREKLEREKLEREQAAAQRKAAEELAAAASAQADKEFAAGRVEQRPGDETTETAEAPPEDATPAGSRDELTIAETTPRLSLKDSAKDRVIEEGSTLGDVDDFDPSVRYVYDMGTGVTAKKLTKKRSARKMASHRHKAKRRAYKKRRWYKKRAKRRAYKKRRVYKKRAKRRRYYRRYARKRRAYRVRKYRARKYRRRVIARRAARRHYRRSRRYGRLYKFKSRRRWVRRTAYAHNIFIPRIRWHR